MASATRFPPSIISVTPKVKRCVPEFTSVPTVPRISPSVTMAKPLAGASDPTVEAATSPSSIIAA